jgi:hypothetical protein
MNTTKIDLLTSQPSSNNTQEQESIFTSIQISLTDFNGMAISDRQDALNFRHRASEPGYQSDWHVAGDPTLIIIRQGKLCIELKDGSRRTYAAGQQFIAADYLQDQLFGEKSGHKAWVEGEQGLLAVHIKLSDNPEIWHQKINQYIG